MKFDEDLIVSRSNSFLIHPEKDTHSLYLQRFQQRPFLEFSENRYKWNIPLIIETL